MHHPGPPRFIAVGEAIELAPRDPDPEEEYRWRVKSAPADSQAGFGDEAVEVFIADKPGLYTLELEAPDGVHELTVRAFPSEYAPARLVGGGSGMSGISGLSGMSGVSGVSGISGLSGMSGSGSAALGADASRGEGGRPRISLTARVEGEYVVVDADARPHPDSELASDDLSVEFLLDDRDDIDESVVEISERSVRVPIDALPELLRVHGIAIGEAYSVADAVAVERAAVEAGELDD